MLTGEAVPVRKAAGAAVTAGTTNLNSDPNPNPYPSP